ncbi:hypothetical protein POM88_033110 [Heracleum sosnowskyi]|uniref:Uncharacterized protein n=1 Tax=Heracleum sosnowskyi TaxID=360622 RepID=A0AAD8I2P6_9APIA|nr:hypothetical protein POM88_033110 [Heracleum sosnowskyi]
MEKLCGNSGNEAMMVRENAENDVVETSYRTNTSSGTSQLASNNYLPISTSIHSLLYGRRTGIGASSAVRRAPPSNYSCFDHVSSLRAANTGNVHNQYSRRTLPTLESLGDNGDEERNILLSTFDI